MLPLKAIFQSLDGKYFFILFYMEFQLYTCTCQIGKDLERSYAVYARSLGPAESHTIESKYFSWARAGAYLNKTFPVSYLFDSNTNC